VSVELLNETDVAVPERDLSALARYVLTRMRIHPAAELSVICVDAGAMSELHVRWMDEEGPTDVLSFPMDELRPGNPDEDPPEGLLGDVVLCPEVAAAQAASAGHSAEQEMRILLAHGILHLLGFDHAEPEEEAVMFGLQRSLVAGYLEGEQGEPS